MENVWKFFDKGEFLDMKVLEDALKTYYISTGIRVFAINGQGDIIADSGKLPCFCEFFRNYTKENCECKKSHLHACRQAELIGEGYVFFCTAGLVHYAAPMINNKTFKGAIIAGPLLMDSPDETAAGEFIESYKLNAGEKEKVLSFLQQLPIIEPSRVWYLSKLLYIVAYNLMCEDRILLKERNEKMIQQSKISESIHDIKGQSGIKNDYPYEKEKELLAKVRNGDAIGAKAALNELLGYVFFTGGGSMEIIKARTLELCTLLSRAAVEGGAALDEMFGINYAFIGELSEIKDIEELSYWTLKVLDRFMENVFNLASSKNIVVIKKAINYINQDYKKDITLDDISSYVHLNPSYFSSLFKKETGMKFSDYLNKVRIEASKKLLRDIRYSILEIALEVGFKDQSYYCKVFKKITGITPKEFKDAK